MRWFRVALLIALVLVAGCEERGEPPVPAERVDSAGIQVVTNRGADRPLALTFTPRLTLGGKDQGPESFFRVVRGSVSVDGAGNIHVLDYEAKSIAIFDSTGGVAINRVSETVSGNRS